jgi:hypothetical protein
MPPNDRQPTAAEAAASSVLSRHLRQEEVLLIAGVRRIHSSFQRHIVDETMMRGMRM